MTFGYICAVSASDEIIKDRQHRLGFEKDWSACRDNKVVICSSNWCRDLTSTIKIQTEKKSNHL